jgi:thioredoxin
MSSLRRTCITVCLIVACTVAAILLLAGNARASLDDCHKASCRVHAQGGSGTGCVYKIDEHYAYVLTNAHVAGSRTGAPMRCVFNRDGYEVTLNGVVCHTTGVQGVRDQAVIAIPVSSFDGWRPSIIPLAPADYQLPTGMTIKSVGCPRAEWASSWIGHVESINGRTLDFVPTPAPGRSGSALFDRDGKFIVGLVTWSSGNVGRAQTVQEIHAGFRGTPTSDAPAGKMVSESDTVLLDFYADWCGPCKSMSPVVDGLVRDGFPVKKVNIDHERELARQYNVTAIPCFVLVDQGREVWRTTGAVGAAELRNAFRVCDQGGSAAAGGSCPTPGGGMSPPSGGGMRPPSSGGDFNPFPKPPVVPPPSNTPATPPTYPEPVAPVAPVVPMPTQPAVKGCDCGDKPGCACDGQGKCECDQEGLNKTLGEIKDKLDGLCKPVEPPKPTNPANCGGEVGVPKLSHYTVVVDMDADSWPRTESEIVMARKTFPKVHVVTRDRIPFEVDVMPQLIAYDTSGAAMSILKGQHAVELALRRIARGDL